MNMAVQIWYGLFTSYCKDLRGFAAAKGQNQLLGLGVNSFFHIEPGWFGHIVSVFIMVLIPI